MIYEKQYIEQTGKLIEFYKDKKSQPIKDYILTCHKYISELRNIDTLEIFDELEYEKSFNQVLSLVDETFRPNTFNSITDNRNLRLLSDGFILYMVSIQKQLKKPIKWNLLTDLQLNFSMLEIQFAIKTGFKEDFTQYAINNISISQLWKTLMK